MTHEQFIEQKTAKLAKQAGFDWEVGTFYNALGKVCCGLPYNWNGETGAYQDMSRPTQSVLQRWLREVKGYQVTVFLTPQVIEEEDCDPRYEFDPNRYGYHVENLNDKGCVEMDDYNCIGYEAALEVGLQECLTLLIEKQ